VIVHSGIEACLAVGVEGVSRDTDDRDVEPPARIVLVASMPSISGISMSIRTTSKVCRHERTDRFDTGGGGGRLVTEASRPRMTSARSRSASRRRRAL
jgi:hypothetical protein